jgi:hypothetical protein
MDSKAATRPASSVITLNFGNSMRPLVVLLGIVMGSTVSIAVALLLTGVVFLLLPQYSARLADESGSLVTACLLSAVLATIAVTSFYGELRERGWRYLAHGVLTLAVGISLWTYWPKS